jgi:hypothetical protein
MNQATVMHPIEIRAFLPGDLRRLDLQQAQGEAAPLLADPDYLAMLAQPGLAWTFSAGPAVVCCGGVLPQWAGRALAWFLIGAVPAHGWRAIVRRSRATLAEAQGRGFDRIETTVRADYAAGHRFLRALAPFEPEGVMQRYSPEGADHVLYALLNRCEQQTRRAA